MNLESNTIRAPRRLAHIALRTNRLEQMIHWYCSVLGAKVVYGSDKIAFLTYDDEHHRIALVATAQFPDKPEQVCVGYAHTAFAYDSLMELFGTYVRLKADDILPVRSINHGPTVSFYYADPDGNQIELQVDSFPDADATTAWMRSEAFERNPIGIEFDPDEMLQKLNSGVPEVELMRRPDSV